MPAVVKAASVSFFGKSSRPPSTLLNGLLGYWRLNDGGTSNGVDASGHGLTATNQNSTPYIAAGFGGTNAANINTSTRGFSVSSSIDTRASSTAFTVSLWFNDLG